MTKQKRKSKQDLHWKLNRIKKVKAITGTVMLFCIGSLFTAFIFALPEILNPESLVSVSWIILVAASFFVFCICLSMQGPIETSINELEKQIRDEGRRFPPDILDRPARYSDMVGEVGDNETRHS